MANQLMTVAEITRAVKADIEKAANGDSKMLRQLYYALGTTLGGFPDTKEAREKAGIA